MANTSRAGAGKPGFFVFALLVYTASLFVMLLTYCGDDEWNGLVVSTDLPLAH